MLKAYIAEWGKFFTQCDYLPKPFMQLVTSLAGKPHGSVQQKKTQEEESLVRKVCIRQNFISKVSGGRERKLFIHSITYIFRIKVNHEMYD